MNLHKLVEPQDTALRDKATILPNEASISKKSYCQEKKFALKDIFRLLMNFNKLKRLVTSLTYSIKLIKNGSNSSKRKLTEPDFIRFYSILKQRGTTSIGFIEVDSNRVFKDLGIPYKYAIIITMNMDKEKFKNAPSMDAQIEVIDIYGATGIAINDAVDFLQNKGYNAVPNHSIGGSIDYCKAGMDAGLGYIGRHGMLMTPENGPCHRSAAIYTDIENLGDFIINNEDHTWIKEFCENCGNCVRKCPTQAIYEEAKEDKWGHITSIDNQKCCQAFKHYGCAVCIQVCPFTKLGYDRNKDFYYKKILRKYVQKP